MSRSCLVLLLVFSILINTISGPVTYSATAVEAIPTAFTLIEWLFLSLGISISLTEGLTDDRGQEQLVKDFEEYQALLDNAEEKPIQKVIDFFSNITDYWSEALQSLVVPEDEWDALLEFANNYAIPSSPTVVDNLPNLYGSSFSEFNVWYSELIGFDSSAYGKLYEHVKLTYDSFAANNYSGLFFYSNAAHEAYYPGETWFSFIPIYSTGAYNFRENSDGASSYVFCRSLTAALSVSVGRYNYIDDVFTRTNNNSFISKYSIISAFYVDGVAYDFHSLFKYPVNSTTDLDFGPSITYDSMFSGLFESFQNVTQVGASDAYVNEGYDVLTPGRELEDDGTITGDVIIGIPSDKVIEKYVNGEISWTDVLATVDVVPVDTSTSTTIAGESTKEVYYEEFASIEESVRSLPQLLLDGIASLFVPSEGFFEAWFSELMAFFKDKLGFLFVPFELMTDLITMFYEAQPGDAILYFPGIYYQEYVIVEPQEVSLDYSEHFPEIYKYIKFGTSIVMIGWVLHLAYLKYEKVVNN